MTNNTKEDYVFAIDLGGTSAKLAIANSEGNIIHKFSVITGKGDDVLPNIKKGLLQEIKKLNIPYESIKKIGFGAKGPFDRKNGIILNAGDINWINYPAREVAKKVFNRDIVITNDSRSAAIGEWRRGAGRKYKNFLCLTLGQGIGCGIILDNKLWVGPRNIAGEIGHGGFMQDIRKCGCGLEHCTEGLSSASGVEWLFCEYINKYPGSSLAELRKAYDRPLRIKDVSRLIKEGDKDVLEALEMAFKPLASRISLAIFLLDLEAVLIGGGPSAIGEPLLAPIKKMLKKITWKSVLDKVDIKVCELGNDAGIIGVVENTLHDIERHNN